MPRIFCAFLTFAFIAGAPRLVAGELTARDLASPEMAVLVELNHPAQLANSSLLNDIWQKLRQTSGGQKAASSSEFDKLRQIGRFIAKSLNVDWQTGISRLTAGGIIVVVYPPDGKAEPDVMALVTASDAPTLAQFVAAVETEIHQTPESKAVPAQLPTRYGNHSIHRVGNGFYSVVDRQLLLANSQHRLEAALDRLAPAESQTSRSDDFELPKNLRLGDRFGPSPTVMATVNLKLLRQDSNLQKALQLPGGDLGPQLLFGGYLDLLRRADWAAAALAVGEQSCEFQFRIAAPNATAHPSLQGFFAADEKDQCAALLKPPGTIYSGVWYRDYGRLWNARASLLSPTIVRDLDNANAQLHDLPTQIGISDLLHWIGPQWRVVLARQREQVYRRKIDQRLPALGLIIKVRDEAAIRDRILAPADGLILFGLNKQIDGFQKLEYRNARMTTFRFSETAAGADPNRAFLFHLNPAFVQTRGHLVIGSTAEIVRDLIDELDRVESETLSGQNAGESVTDRQLLSLSELFEFLKDFREQIVRNAAENQTGQNSTQGLDDVERDVDLLAEIMKRIGSIAASFVVATDHVDFALRFGRLE
jgi:hypothetical protein